MYGARRIVTLFRVWWRRAGGRGEARSSVQRAHFAAHVTRAGRLSTLALVRAVSDVGQKSGPELEGVCEAHTPRGRRNVQRGSLSAVRAKHQGGKDKRSSFASGVPF